MRQILYLDQSPSRTGWMLWRSGRDPLSGSWPLAGAKHRGEMLRELFGHIDQMHKAHRLTEICHEQPVMGAANQGHAELIAQISMIGVIDLWCCSRGLPAPRSHHVQSWRTTWFLKHERKAIAAMPAKLKDWKGRAVRRARQFGFDPATHDEAEAIAIADHDLLAQKITPAWRAADLQLEPVI